jgi:hypothetical protein
VGGVCLSILIGMPLRELYGELIGTLSILGISAGVVFLAGMVKNEAFDMSALGVKQAVQLES